MTFHELLHSIMQHSRYPIANGDVINTLQSALDEQHPNQTAGGIIASLYRNSGLASPEDSLERVQAVKALGPIRLFYMKDDAPVEGFRMVEDIVHAIDGAYNDEALRQKS